MNSMRRVAALVAALAMKSDPSKQSAIVSLLADAGRQHANAALARENGISRATFLGRLEEDLELIQAYPPQLRWFAKDRDDEAFLYENAREVFDQPLTPDQHRARFLAACLDRGMV